MPIAIGCKLLVGSSSAQKQGASTQTDIGPPAVVRVSLRADGLPDSFFQPGSDTKCASQANDRIGIEPNP